MKELNSRQLQAEKTRTLILSTVLEMLKEKDYSSISISSICKKIGISIGALYHHFSTKEDIIYNVFIGIEEDLTKDKNKINICGTDFKETIINHLSFNIDYYINFHSLSLLKHTASALINSGGKYYFCLDRLTAKEISRILVDAQNHSLIKPSESIESITERIFIIYTGAIIALCIHAEAFNFRKELETLVYPYLDSLQE